MKYTDNYQTLFDIADDDSVDIKWLVDQLLPVEQPAILYGQKNVHKSHLALHLGICIATGDEFFGLKTQQSPVIFLALEGKDSMKPRILAHWTHYGKPTDLPFVVLSDPFEFDQDEDDLIQAIKAFSNKQGQVGLVIIDTLSFAYPRGDENSAGTARLVSKGLMKICTEANTSILVIHHSGKDMRKGARGSSVLENDLPTVLLINNSQLIVKHQRSGQSGKAYPFDVVLKELNAEGNKALAVVYKDDKDSDATGWSKRLLNVIDLLAADHPHGLENKLLFDGVYELDPRAGEVGYKDGSFNSQFYKAKKALVTSAKIKVTQNLIQRN